MSQSTLLSQIGEANKSFLAGSPRLLDSGGDPFVVVTCIDPRLTGLLEPALGLPRNRAAVIRTAGNQLSERTQDGIRSIAVALYVKKAREIIIVGHTDCGMAGFSAAEVTENFRKAGIPRSAFGNEDLRVWFGAFASIRDNLLNSIAYLRKSGIVPQDIKIQGLILDTIKGSIEMVVDENLPPAGIAPTTISSEPYRSGLSAAEMGTEAALTSTPPENNSAQPPPAQTEPKGGKGPIIIGQSAGKQDQTPPSPGSLIEAALVLRDFFNRERQSQQMQKAVSDLRTIWKQERSPYRVIAEIQKIGHAYEARYPSLPGALAYLENAVRSGSADKIGFEEVMRRILD